MMVHPAPFDAATMKIIAASMFEAAITARNRMPRHSLSSGINAADALTVAQVRWDCCGSTSARPIASTASSPRAEKRPTSYRPIPLLDISFGPKISRSSKNLREKVRRCFEAGALATGAKLEILGGDKPYAQMHHDLDMAAMYQRNAEELGRKFPDFGPMKDRMAASTDMGNVSQVIPSIHPAISIGSLPAVNHQPEFTAHCVTDSADQAMFDGALAMAWTIADLATNPSTRARLLG